MIKKQIDLAYISPENLADFIGKKPEGFTIAEIKHTEMGATIVEYTYPDWGFNTTVIIIPLLDTGFVQIHKL